MHDVKANFFYLFLFIFNFKINRLEILNLIINISQTRRESATPSGFWIMRISVF